jgi:hypothetical protein
MKTSLPALFGASALLTAIAAFSLLLAGPASPTATSGIQLAGPPRELTQYGHIRSLTRAGARYVLRFDPAFWLGGTTANRAAVEDGVIRPGEAVPNDYYVRDESPRPLTYRVPANARVTIVTSGPRSTAITVPELAQIVKGKNPRRRQIFGRALGFWIRVATDTVRSLDQQYQP